MSRLTVRQLGYLDALGIQHWVERSSHSPAADAGQQARPALGEPARTGGAPATPVDWQALQQAVAGCTRCELHNTRTNTVFGTGNEHAKWMFIGEAPGADEDRQGQPFVGRAGQLLNAMLKAIGLDRKQVYIANVLKCRPPNNRDPMGQEVRECEPYLHQQVAYVAPELIVALGRFAAQSLLKTSRPISKLRNETFTYEGIPLVVTYHPAYLLRSPLDKRKAWEDLCRARQLLGNKR